MSTIKSGVSTSSKNNKTMVGKSIFSAKLKISSVFSMIKLLLDDDCKINNEHVKKMLINLNELGPGNSIAPIYFDEKTGICSHSYKKGLKGFITNFISTFICGAPWGLKRMGRISKVGTNYGVDVKYMKKDIAHRNKEVKRLIFEESLRKADNRRKGNQNIMHFFGKV